jgi:hypothetical protein
MHAPSTVGQPIMRSERKRGNLRSDGVGSSWVAGVLFADRFSKNTSRKCAQGYGEPRRSMWCKSRDHVRRTPQRYPRPAARNPAHSGRSRRLPHRHRARPAGLEWPRSRRATNRGVPRRVRFIRSCSITSRPFAHRLPACAMGKACPASSSRSSGTLCNAAGSPAGSGASGDLDPACAR